MSVKSDYLNKPLAQIALDQGFEISGFDESFYEDKTLDSERQYKIKVADYNKGELLSKAFGLSLDSKFETALNLQSKKPLYVPTIKVLSLPSKKQISPSSHLYKCATDGELPLSSSPQLL